MNWNALEPVAKLAFGGAHGILRLAFGFLSEALGHHRWMICAFSDSDFGLAHRFVGGTLYLVNKFTHQKSPSELSNRSD